MSTSNHLVAPLIACLLIAHSLSLATTVSARTLFDRGEMYHHRTLARIAADPPYINVGVHAIGNISLTVVNNGTFGDGFAFLTLDPRTGEPVPSCEFPINSNVEYLFGAAFWIGAIVGRDTLVSTGADGWSTPGDELNPASLEEQINTGEEVTYRSIVDPNSPEFENAVSEEDIVMIYYDTLVQGVAPDPLDSRPHTPLSIRIQQTSYAWSYSYAEDFVLFDYKITNIHPRHILEQVYMGFYVDGDVAHASTRSIDGYEDDICGFRLAVEQLNFKNSPCTFSDTVRLAWIADNDGYNGSGPVPSAITGWDRIDPTGVTGMRVIRTPSDSLRFSFNWWISNGNPNLDFGPRLSGTESEPFRDFGGNLGTPLGDRNKYYVLSHEEFDYDQLYSAVDQTDQGWLPPGPQGPVVADGFDTRYLLSFGPFTVFPGETLPITFAYIAGSDFHRDPQDMNNLYNTFQPDAYYNSLDFSDFGLNAQWASWIYDNPGVDSDSDGNFGKFRLCCDSNFFDSAFDTFYNFDSSLIDSIVFAEILFTDCDTLFYEGDGVPDFLGASPPPAPTVQLTPTPGELRVNWNGKRSETTPDAFSLILDFEGYRVYMGLNNRITDMILQTSYDRENFTRFFFDGATSVWKIAGPPQTLAEVRFLYASSNQNYDPLFNGIDNPLRVGDSLFYFISQDWNSDDLTDPNEIHKVFPDEPYPHTLLLDSAFTFDTFYVDESSGDTTWYPGGELTDDGESFKYFEYEYIIRGLSSSQLHFVSVTAFDFGAPESGLDALETSPLFNVVSEYPQNSSSVIADNDLQVVVYPNPYRIDGAYRDHGFEGRTNDDQSDERVRAVHFTNLPPVCTIRIFTLDGDMVREIDHNTFANEPESMHAIWNLVTRNTQMAASGIYYWTVETPTGDVQVGKLVLIM